MSKNNNRMHINSKEQRSFLACFFLPIMSGVMLVNKNMKITIYTLLILYSQFSHADFGTTKFGQPYIFGDIKEGDYAQLKNHISQNRNDPSINPVHIKSLGGDLNEAMKIGRLIRALSFSTYTPVSGKGAGNCASACFFIYVAGVTRTYWWDLDEKIEPYKYESDIIDYKKRPAFGLHRPYFNYKYYSSLPLNDAKKQYEKTIELAYGYLKEMSVPQNIIDMIWRIPSDEVKWISMNDFYTLIGKSPPYYSEYLISIKDRCNYFGDEENANMLNYENYIRSVKEVGEKASSYLKEEKLLISKKYYDYLEKEWQRFIECSDKIHKNNRLQAMKKIFD